MKLIKLIQAKITEDGEIKPLGTVYINPEKVIALWSAIDRFETSVKNGAVVCIEGNVGPMCVQMDIDKLSEQITDAQFSS